jgi:CRP/FNR family transcriptional regulator
MIHVNLLSQVHLFSVLNTETLEWLSGQCRLKEYAKNQDVVCKGDHTTELLFLLQGRLLVLDTATDGQQIALHIIQPGDCVGELSAIDGEPRAATLRAMDPAVVGLLPREAFSALLDRSPAVSKILLQRFAAVVRANNRQRVILSINNVQRRVAALLLSHSKKNEEGGKGGTTLIIRRLPTQQELAAMANTSRESVSRVLSALIEQGLVIREGRDLLIPNPAALQKMIQQEI